ncbi:MAG: trypsin-like peptidase domain-containing protein [Flavobacteriales bacterium]
MKRTLLTSAATAAMFISNMATAQVSFGGKPLGLGATKSNLPAVPVEVMPAVDALTLLVEDAERLASGDKRMRFGKNHATDFTLDNSGVWSVQRNGDRVWRLGIECPGAYSINFAFTTFVVPEGGQVFVYNPLGHVLGSFTAASHPGHTVLGVDLLMGDRITIEYIEPAAVAGQGQLRIGQVTHGYRDSFGVEKGFGASGACNINVVCPITATYADQIRSVARIVVGGGDWCTGQLVDNCAHDKVPYFLTADQCVSGQNPALWVFAFNWHSTNCSFNTLTPMNQTVSGASIWVSGVGNDVALLQLDADPPASYNVFFTGWDKSGATPSQSRSIHHPNGDQKKFSIDDDPATSSTYNGVTSWKIGDWDQGTTEPGSTGGGLWDLNGRLIGLQTGGSASCLFNSDDYFGKFSTSFTELEPYLGTCGNTTNGLDANTAIAEGSAIGQLEVFPNPSNGSISVVVPDGVSGVVRIRVSDGVGRIVVDATMDPVSHMLPLDLSFAADGMYSLELMANDVRWVQRIALQN